jgi:hypothetical protein
MKSVFRDAPVPVETGQLGPSRTGLVHPYLSLRLKKSD